jgi:protein SCO1/2
VKWLAFLAVLLHGTAVAAQSPNIEFEPHLGIMVPGEVAFREGRLDDYYGRVPVVLVLGYLGCVNLCGTTLTGVDEALRGSGLVPGRDYTALFVSVDPRDEKAAPERRPGWHFLTGATAAAQVAHAVGFRYSFEKESGQYAHPAGFVVLTPQGKVAQYFEGVRFDSRELKNVIHEAGQGRTQTAFQRLLFVCFHDPLGGRHTPAVMAAVRIVMSALLVAAAFFAWRRLR